MMNLRNLFSGLTVLLLTAPIACRPLQGIQENAPPQGEAPEHSSVTEYYAYHNDQGMLADRSIADIHFVPHTAELSGTGIARLDRYAQLLASDGGTLHYDTAIRDRQLLNDRLAAANEFLADISFGEIRVVSGLPGGPGMGSNEAIGAAAVARQPEPRSSAYSLEGG